MKHDPMSETVYIFVCDYIGEKGYPPNQREIAEGCSISKGAVSLCLNRLEAAGRIARQSGKSRSIRLMKHPPARRSAPRVTTNYTTEAIYAFIQDYIEQHGYSPSIREIARGIGVGATAVLNHLRKLKQAGRISYVPYQPRTIRLAKRNTSTTP